MKTPLNPAANLVGLQLDGGWEIVRQIPAGYHGTGGNFSISYEVKDETGRLAFLKAMDYSRALREPDPAAALNELTEAYLFERDLLFRCNDKRMSKVVKALDHGSVNVPTPTGSEVVQYLIFEQAEGDVRKYLAFSKRFDLAWCLRCMHHVTTGVRQLHNVGAAHQDVKPSNVLVFGGATSKIADVGCASIKGEISPHDHWDLAGDPTYSPPEFDYGFIPSEWETRRLACDLYHLGSLAVFFLTGSNMSAALYSDLPQTYHHRWWGGSFEEVLPCLRNATDKILVEICDPLPESIRDDLLTTLKYLCEPDPRLRGDPRSRIGIDSDYSLQRFVSAFNRLARKAELGI